MPKFTTNLSRSNARTLWALSVYAYRFGGRCFPLVETSLHWAQNLRLVFGCWTGEKIRLRTG